MAPFFVGTKNLPFSRSAEAVPIGEGMCEKERIANASAQPEAMKIHERERRKKGVLFMRYLQRTALCRLANA
jgi:hypothetical protein